MSQKQCNRHISGQVLNVTKNKELHHVFHCFLRIIISDFVKILKKDKRVTKTSTPRCFSQDKKQSKKGFFILQIANPIVHNIS
jgi:hypothetical protein